jgi:hypothetical protein
MGSKDPEVKGKQRTAKGQLQYTLALFLLLLGFIISKGLKLVKKVSGKMGLRIRKSRVNREPHWVNFNTPLHFSFSFCRQKNRKNGLQVIKGG